MVYQPGTHLIATLHTENSEQLKRSDECRAFFRTLIAQYDLRNLGEVFHDFEPAGFTCVICLSESHISIHTWPEFGKINMDIYLSNYQRTNDGTVHSIFEATVNFFQASVEQKTQISR